ncbi:MAG: metallophosphoesterase, partial [Clostridia bacterium]|nr:metallophosphoesterase [Clostridia bacterium]
AGYRKFILFLHYPPTSILERESVFTRMAKEWGAEQVIYAHCHGESRFHDSLLGEVRGVRYSLASGDFLNWMPMKALD